MLESIVVQRVASSRKEFKVVTVVCCGREDSLFYSS